MEAQSKDRRILFYWEEGGRSIRCTKRRSKKTRQTCTFRLTQDCVDDTRRAIYPKELDLINRQFRAGLLTEDAARIQVKALIKILYKRRDQKRPRLHPDRVNEQLLDKYWEAEYGPERDIEDRQTMRKDFERALLALGSCSLLTSDQRALQTQLNTYFNENPRRQRRAVSRLNSLLTYYGRGFRLKKMRDSHEEVVHVTFLEFLKILPRIQDPAFRALCGAAFATGLRASELFGLEPRDWVSKEGYLNVSRQLKEGALKPSPTKTRRPRKAYIIEELQDCIQAWLALPVDEKHRLREIKHARELQKTAPALRFHDLRHSYSIHLLSKGIPLDFVAQSLGNSRAVCEKYYTGYVLAESSMNMIRRIMQKSPSD